MLEVSIKAADYYLNELSLRECEQQECIEINQSDSFNYLAEGIFKNAGGSDGVKLLVKAFNISSFFSGISISAGMQQFHLSGFTLPIKIMTDQKYFKEAMKEVLKPLSNNPLSASYDKAPVVYDKKLWDYENLTEALSPPYIILLGGWLGVRSVTVEDINRAWKILSDDEKRAVATKASVRSWVTNDHLTGSMFSYETPSTGDFINIIQANAPQKWLQPAIWPDDDESFRLLLSGPSGSSTRMMLYFKWFHKALSDKDNETITRGLRIDLAEERNEAEKIKEGLSTSEIEKRNALFEKRKAKFVFRGTETYYQFLERMRNAYNNRFPGTYNGLRKSYLDILKGIHMPPFNHHSRYEVETAVEGI